jgi:polyvinyl alcohol dehydrogenase (cytochrome)
MIKTLPIIALLLWAFPYFANAQNGAQIYTTKCAICHSGSVKEAPRLEALKLLSEGAIITSLQTGVMKAQGTTLSAEEKKLVAAYISSIRNTTDKPKVVEGLCGQNTPEKNPQVHIANWGMGLENKRYISDNIEINARNVEKLALSWAFAFPEATRARSQPTIAGNTLYTCSQHGLIYALDVATGCIRWTFQVETEVRSAIVIGTDKNGEANRLYFGDFKANVYAFDLKKRTLLWKKRVEPHEQATITGSLALYQNRLYVPVSSTEVIAAYNPQYPCCTFRGSVVALDTEDGKEVWKTYMTDTPEPQGLTSAGVQRYAPSGAPIWSNPTLDLKRGLIYIGTGENYTRPATHTSDAIIALSMDTGKMKWIRQTISQDSWNGACTPPGSANCPENHGPDYDFGAPPILIRRAEGDLVLAGQKSGMVYALDPDNEGKIVWQKRVGRGGIMGGVHWGMASDGQTLFVPINDHDAWEADKSKPAYPGLHALDIANGTIKWSVVEKNRCPSDVKWVCDSGLSAAITAIPDMIFGGALDGMLKAYATSDGKVLWEFDTNQDFTTVNGVKGYGGTIDSAGAVVVGNHLFINSGYAKFGEKAGNVLLCFKIK